MALQTEMRSADLLARRVGSHDDELESGFVDAGQGAAHTVPAYLWPQVLVPTVIYPARNVPLPHCLQVPAQMPLPQKRLCHPVRTNAPFHHPLCPYPAPRFFSKISPPNP